MDNWINKIPTDWGAEALNDSVSNIVDNRGKTCPTADVGMPLIATNCIKEYGLYPTWEKLRYVDDKTYKNWFRGHPEPNDILFVNKGTPGGVCLVPDPVPFCIAQDMVALRAAPKKFEWKYLFAALRSRFVRSQIEALNVGTSIPHLKKTDFKRIIIPKPSVSEQIVIGEIYFSLCKKIELNLQMNKTLEDMAMALYKHWFVDFGPFQEGAFVQSELGEIPEGWEVKRLDDVVELIIDHRGKTPKKLGGDWSDSPSGCFEAISAKNIKGGKIVKPETIKFLSNELYRKWMKVPLRDKDILLTSEAPIGEYYFILNKTDYCLSQRLFALRADPQILCPEILYCFISSNSGHQQLLGRGSGSTVQGIKQSELRKLVITVPKMEAQIKVSKRLLNYFQLMRNNYTENQTLTTLRDTLLPQLISGEVRVNNIENSLRSAL